MSNELSTWDDVRRVADELGLQLHLAGMDARDRWHELEPRLLKLEQQIAHELGAVWRDVRDRVRVAYKRGW